MKNEKLQGQNVSRETRRYSWEVICYAPKEDVLKVISKYEDMSHYLLVTHDRDKLEDGSLKKLHTHLYITLRVQKYRKRLAEDISFLADGLFTVVKENIEAIKGSLRDCWKYAQHLEQPNKERYSVDELVSDKMEVFSECKTNSDDNIGWNVLEDLASGCSLREMAQKYGRDFILNFRKYDLFYRCMLQDDFDHLTGTVRPKTVFTPVCDEKTGEVTYFQIPFSDFSEKKEEN